MSELTNWRKSEMAFRRQLLSTVSALSLAIVCGSDRSLAADQDTDRPTLWIELGGQLERQTDSQSALDPSFLPAFTRPSLSSALNVQSPPANALGLEGKILFEPSDSNWQFSASFLYGRSSFVRHHHQQTANAKVPVQISFPAPFTAFRKYYSAYPNEHVRFADGKSSQSKQHAVLDFQAGKDVGLGMISAHGSSTFSVGVRFAQFVSKESLSLSGIPDLQYPGTPIVGTFSSAVAKLNAFRNAHIRFHAYSALLNAQRSFVGLGPSLSWNASMPLIGDADRLQLSLDWGANAALLFGRQKAKGRHQTAAHSYYKTHWAASQGAPGKVVPGRFRNYSVTYANVQTAYTPGNFPHHTSARTFNRMRIVTVPNVGGFAGASFRYADAKISFGYRADFFFGAMDGGIDLARKENQDFYGPFATISVGIP